MQQKTKSATSLPKIGQIERQFPATDLSEKTSLSEIDVISDRLTKRSRQSDKFLLKNRGCSQSPQCLKSCTSRRDPMGFPVQKAERTVYAVRNICPHFHHTPGSRSPCGTPTAILGQNRNSGPIPVDFAEHRFLKQRLRTLRDVDSQVIRNSL